MNSAVRCVHWAEVIAEQKEFYSDDDPKKVGITATSEVSEHEWNPLEPPKVKRDLSRQMLAKFQTKDWDTTVELDEDEEDDAAILAALSTKDYVKKRRKKRLRTVATTYDTPNGDQVETIKQELVEDWDEELAAQEEVSLVDQEADEEAKPSEKEPVDWSQPEKQRKSAEVDWRHPDEIRQEQSKLSGKRMAEMHKPHFADMDSAKIQNKLVPYLYLIGRKYIDNDNNRLYMVLDVFYDHIAGEICALRGAIDGLPPDEHDHELFCVDWGDQETNILALVRKYERVHPPVPQEPLSEELVLAEQRALPALSSVFTKFDAMEYDDNDRKELQEGKTHFVLRKGLALRLQRSTSMRR